MKLSDFERYVPCRLRPRIHGLRYIRQATAGRVYSGPFAGQRQPDGGNAAMLAGTYEMELHPFVASLIADPPDLVVDIGAADGYYAVGLAQHCPEARHIAFETCAEARRLLHARATLNGVDGRIDVRPTCTAASLAAVLAGPSRPFVLMDVEGAEQHLLDPDAVPPLREACILVETHEAECPGIEALLRQRFEPTHTIAAAASRPRTRHDNPFPRRAWWIAAGLRERPEVGQVWLWMTPRNAATARRAA